MTAHRIGMDLGFKVSNLGLSRERDSLSSLVPNSLHGMTIFQAFMCVSSVPLILDYVQPGLCIRLIYLPCNNFDPVLNLGQDMKGKESNSATAVRKLARLLLMTRGRRGSDQDLVFFLTVRRPFDVPMKTDP